MARVRKQAGAKEQLYSYSDYVVLEPYQYKGHWQEIFANDRPIHLEIGMGRGSFIFEMALRYPEINFIGLEVIEEIINEAIERMEQKGGVPQNLRFIWINAQNLADIFDEGEIAQIYLNFSDPWPKNRHSKRRLTHHNFLNQYEQILQEGGKIQLKTDSMGLFEFSLNEFAAYDWQMSEISLDLYRKLPPDNVPTEYESKFVKRGLPIYRLLAAKVTKKGNESSKA